MEYSDDDLLEMIASADSAGFAYLYRKHFNMVKHLIGNNSGTDEDASDIFQEVLIILFEQVRDGKLRLTASLKTYLYSIARNQWLKKLRTMKKHERIKNFEEFIIVEEDSFVPDFKLGLLLNEIGEACRKLLLLFYYRKKSMEEICLELNYANADTAKNQKYKCIQRLKKLTGSKS
jgi:RNA polymerase sigma factor (sigma-70 family)